MITHTDQLIAWIEDADAALDRPGGLTTNQLRALAARPEKAAHLRQGFTWFLEEQLDVMRDQERDKRPNPEKLGEAAVAAWAHLQQLRTERMLSLLAQHNEALQLAANFAKAEGLRKARAGKATRADAATARADLVRAALAPDDVMMLEERET